MEVEVIYHTPLWVCSRAIRRCWASEDKSDTAVVAKCSCCGNTYLQDEHCTLCCPSCECSEYIFIKQAGEKDKALINRIGNQNKHSSTLEHLVYSFDIDGISRACLQEVARHRMASYSVKSTRYTLKELKDNKGTVDDYLVPTGNLEVDTEMWNQLNNLQRVLQDNISNDIAKYMLPEAYKTSLVMTINARSLQNFLQLRTSKSALWEIRELAYAMFDALPDDHKYLFEECIANKGE